MRTTIDLDDDVLLAVKERARRERRSAGAVLSELARTALIGPPVGSRGDPSPGWRGFRPLPRRGRLVTNELINEIRDELGD